MFGKNRDWGFFSYNVDDENDDKLGYTSYEKSGRVNKYVDNGDGGHSHATWKDKDDYNKGEEPDWERTDSGDSGSWAQSGRVKITGFSVQRAAPSFTVTVLPSIRFS